MAVSDRIIYEFGDFRLIPDDDLLLRGDEAIPLTPKVFSTLVMLIERHGHLVRKEDLIEKIWAGSFVDEAAVSRCVWTIRNALGEDSKSNSVIQTVPKRGYKFVADVNERTAPAASNGSGPVESLAVSNRSAHGSLPYSTERSSRRPRLADYLVLTLLAVVSMAGWYLSSIAPSAVATGAPSSMAVLPSQPIDSQNRSEIHEIGIAEALIHRLSTSKGLIVRPLSSVRNYAAIDQDPVAAGSKLKVDYVLTSNYQLADGKIRITAQLTDVASGGVQDTYKVETAAENIFALQDAVADEIAKKLLTRFDRTTAGQMAKRGTNNEEAYRLYLQAKNLTMRRTRESGAKAVEYLEQALALDPNFALGWAQMARSYRKTDGEQESEKVKEFINKALELDPNVAEAYVARAEYSLVNEWNFVATERDLKKALELEPNNDQAHWLSAMLLVNRGHIDAALTEVDTALLIDPGAVMYMFHRGRILYYGRRYEEALTQYQQATDLDDRFMHPFNWRARVHEIQGDHAAAYESFLKGEARSPRKDLIDVYRELYETKGWMAVRGHVAATKPRTVWFDLARLHALQGNKDAAFENLDRAVEKREWLVITLQVEPALDGLRDDPRFAALLKRIALERG